MPNATDLTTRFATATPRQRDKRGSAVPLVLASVAAAHLCNLWQMATLPQYSHPTDWLLSLLMLGVLGGLGLAYTLGRSSRELLSAVVVTNAIFLLSKLAFAMFVVGTAARIETELYTTMYWLLTLPILAAGVRLLPLAASAVWWLPGTLLALTLLFAVVPQGEGMAPEMWFGIAQLGLAYLTVVLSAHFLTRLRAAYSQSQQQSQQLGRLAFFDSLTGMHNRTYLDQRLHDLCRQENRLAVLFFDLDGFKVINDTLGHATGDQVLRLVAQRLKEMEHATACLARVGGDEFVVVLTGRSEAEVGSFAQWVVTELSKPLTVDGHLLRLSVSLGISLFPDDAQNPHDLLLRADRAMYSVKRSGKNGFHFYGAEVLGSDEERQLLERELRHAHERGELFLMLQPICDLQSGEPLTVEALLRWRHPEFGLVRPDVFIPLAEEAGLIAPIGEWVLTAALAAAQVWQAEGFNDLRIAVNVSPLQLMQAGFVDMVRQKLEHFDLPPSVLELEVTEGVDLHERTQVMDCLRELRELGVTLSLDDFGTGFASLSRLNELPVDTVKIDKVFVADLTGDVAPERARYVRTLISAMVSVASTLGLRLVVEGVETPEQRRVLGGLGCSQAQGYLYSRPINEAELRGKLWAHDWAVPETQAASD